MNAGRQGSSWRIATLLTVLSMILAACASGGGASTAPSASSSTAAPASSAAASSSAVAPASSAAASSSATTSGSASAFPSGSTATSGSASASASASGSAAAPAGSTAAGGVPLNADVSGTVNLWHFWGSPVRRNAIRRVVAICGQQLPNIQITETFKPFDALYTAHIAAVAAGSGMADVIVEDRPQLPARAADGIDISLQEFATRDGITGEEFWPFTWQQTLYEDATYGIPYETDVRVLYYNKNAFKEVGLDPEKPPTTWDELAEYTDKLDKKNGDTIERMGFSPLLGNGPPGIWGWTNGFQPIADDGTFQLNDPKHVETLEWVKTWIDQRYGGYQNHQNFKANFGAAPNDAFMSGRVAMLVETNGYASQLNAFRPQVPKADGSGNEELQWGVAALPYKTEPATASGGFALSIPKGSPNAEAAWEFIKCATGPDGQASWARDTYSMPARVEAASDPVLTADPNWQLFVDQMEVTKVNPFVPEYPNWEQELGNRYEKMWTGELSVQEALDEAQQAVQSETGQ